MKIEQWKPEKLIDYARNPRKNDHVVERVAAAIKEFGFRVPIIAKSDGLVIDGHLRLKAARKLGLDKVPVVLADDMTDTQIKAFRISVNRMAELADWDTELLALEMQDLTAAGIEMDVAGFSAEELDALSGKSLSNDVSDVADDVPGLEPDAVTRSGDIWILGGHRVMCGDAMNVDDVTRAKGGLTPGLTIVDPPYEMADSVWDRWIADPCVVFGQARHLRRIPDALWRFERVIVKRYRHRSATVQLDHRHAFVAQCGSVKTLPRTSETFPSVIDQEVDREHDHAKPVALLVEHMTKWTPPWDVCVDPFLGSGSSVIAAETIGRRCVGLELSPQYCDVIVKRWQTLTGKQATRESDGITFDEARSQYA